MNRQNQDRADKVAHVYKKGRKVRGADEVLKRALADCMQEEAQQTQKKMETEGQHAFSKPFIEKMQFVLKQGKQAEEQQKKKVRGRRWTRVAAACIVCVVVAGGSWIGLRGNVKTSQNETSGSAAKTETASEEESLEMGKSDYADTISGNVDASDTQENESNVLNEDKKEGSRDSVGTEENTSASVGILAKNVDIKVLEVTPTSLKVRLTNNGDEDISFGDDYEGIEVYDEATDTWMECQKQYEIACHDILHFVKSGDKQNWFDWYVDWANVYGSLEAGHYRLQKNISIGNIDGGDQYVQLIQIEFNVR
ncbi:immunoglobulin-like domain-containing protein [uncultured Eubacterium sp.]|uniref:immunoglobulin-like domain-containing protein n=1 Tax=uncultured Eubacterium sp. TaxID=165185 RepID=UPI0025D5B6E9|nr:immunoglobulin-like domain-containing protein [uncultured Eubacterium sp.]